MSTGNMVVRTHRVRPLYNMPSLIPLRFNALTRDGMKLIREALNLQTSPSLPSAVIDHFIRGYLVGNTISLEKLCTEDPARLRWMVTRETDHNLTDDDRLQIMLGRIGLESAVLE